MADALCHQRLFLSSLISFLFLSIICWQPAAQAETIDAAPAGTFSIVIIPDTQRYKTVEVQQEGSGKKVITNPVFEKWTDWIAANLMRQNSLGQPCRRYCRHQQSRPMASRKTLHE